MVLVLGAVLIGNHFCTERDKVVPVEIRYRLPAPRPEKIEVRVLRAGDVAATYLQRPTSGEAVHETRLPPGLYELDVTLTFGAIERRVARTVEARRDAVITVDLSGERP